MMASTLRGFVTACLVAVGAASGLGCSIGGESAPPPIPVDSGVSGMDYPSSPYGTSVGDVMPNFVFQGYPDPSKGMGPEHLVAIAMGSFYNPSGEGTHDADSPFEEGAPLPKAMLINISAVWCGPCQLEAAKHIPEHYAELAPVGGEIMLNLADGPDPGVPGEAHHLDGWASSYDVNYPAVIDPKYQLGGLFDSSAFPANILVDTRTMVIEEITKGIPQESFWTKFEELLHE